MSTLQALLLGLLQGATEFIPISSSGHLVLVPWLLGWREPGLAFDAIVHWGTLIAVVGYFWRDLASLTLAWLRGWRTRSWSDPQGRLAWLILLGTLPAIALGLLLENWFEELFSAPTKVAGFLLATGLLLVVSERLGRREREERELGWRDALIIGLGQAMAIAPGISRSGATIAVGLLRGLRRETAARFGFLLALPVILGAGLLQLAKLAESGQGREEWPALALGFITAASSGYLCIRLLLGYLRHHSLYPFALYCCVAGLMALALGLPSLAGSKPPPTPDELVLAGPEPLHPLMWTLGRAYQAWRPYIAIIVQDADADHFDLAFTYQGSGEGRRVPIALDGVAVVVHPQNPLRELTLLQVQDIFAGRAYDWEPLGGGQGEIKVLDQMDGTPSRAFFAERVMKSRAVTPNAFLVPNDAAAVREVASDPLAIGYASVGHLTSGVKALAIEGISPTPENLAQGSYHLIRPVYLVIPDRPSEEAQNFVDFVLSEEGQEVVAERYGRVEIIRCVAPAP